eukprot:5756935-Alexandrium_andersonii.AAC.1
MRLLASGLPTRACWSLGLSWRGGLATEARWAVTDMKEPDVATRACDMCAPRKCSGASESGGNKGWSDMAGWRAKI